MLFAVFVGFYLYTDHAPVAIWVMAAAGFVYDLLKELGDGEAEVRWRKLMLWRART